MTDTARILAPDGSTARADVIFIILLIALWAAMVIAANPLGNFPLNDDWSYGKSVQRVLATGRFDLPDWTSSNHIAQIYWGALFCLPFGFSFTALRFSTLALGLVGVLAVFVLLREFHPRPPVPILGALLIALNPIYFGLSNTFMTDVPFFALFVLSLWLYSRGLRRNMTEFLVLGVVAAGFALMIRQFGLVLFVAFGCAYIFKKGTSLKNVLTGILMAGLGGGLQISYQAWLRATGRGSAFFGNPARDVNKILSAGLSVVVLESLKRVLEYAIYSGMFLFPFLLLLFVRQCRSWPTARRRWMIGFLAVFSTVTLAEFVLHDIRMPFTNNVMSNLGLAPLTLRDASFGPTSFATPPAMKALWIALTVVGVLGAGLLFAFFFLGGQRILRKRRAAPRPETWTVALVFSAVLIYFFSILARTFFDRYLLPFWPLFLILGAVAAADAGPPKRAPGTVTAVIVLFLVCYGGFAVGATHDYLLWNSVRWNATRSLMQDIGVTPHHIDGGFEFNGWYLYDRAYRSSPGKSWWWVDEDDYSVVFGPIPGYQAVKTYPLKRWLPFGPETILVLRKNMPLPQPGS
jgi:4-amino-4-deoxy-L-arabinose transferase-like glycosyltransferase